MTPGSALRPNRRSFLAGLAAVSLAPSVPRALAPYAWNGVEDVSFGPVPVPLTYVGGWPPLHPRLNDAYVDTDTMTLYLYAGPCGWVEVCRGEPDA